MEKQAEERETMKNMKEIFRKQMLWIYAILLSVIGMAMNVSAEPIGSDYTLMGFNLGWALVIIGIAFFVLVGLNFIKKGTAKKMGVIFVAMLLIGLALVFVEKAPETSTAQQVTSDCCDFDFSASAIASGGDFITTTTWDEDTNTLTIPLTVADSSDGNLTGSAAGVNITLEAMGATNDMNCYFTVSSDYTMKYGGEDVLDKTGNSYRAEITTDDGTEYYEDTFGIAAGSTDWVNVSWFFVNGTSGSWVSELSQVGDSLTWYIDIENECGSSERITVTAIVVSYTA
jgi:hypothetical protein